MTGESILVVEDEEDILDLISYNLKQAGFSVIAVESGEEALEVASEENFSLVLLDLMLPGVDGLEVCRLLRAKPETKNIPVLMLTARTEEVDRIVGLELGADDYLTKPFSPRELVARIKAVLRRISEDEVKEIIEAGSLRFDPISHFVTIAGEEITLGPTEYRLLHFFLKHQNRVFSRDQILDFVWGANVYLDDRTIDVHIRRLRKSIAVAGCDQYVQTVRGAGYRFSIR